jgi:hypothetical protein
MTTACQIEGCGEKHYGKGYCRYHYKWFVEAGHEAPNTSCLMCGVQLTKRRGSKYCSNSCQMKWHRRYGCYAKDKGVQPAIAEPQRGTYREAFIRKSPRACSVDGCSDPALARGFCDKHYHAFSKHGAPVSPFGYAERKRHPLYNTWRWQGRSEEGRVSAWDDFWQFVADVGERPTPRHELRRHSAFMPWGPGNFYWRERGEKAASLKEQARDWRARNPLRAKGHGLRYAYGISLEEYDRMYHAQGGKCALCGAHGSSYDQARGRTDTLAVDHCHNSKAVRELLCMHCNRGIGCFKDSPELLEKAIQYLKKHAAKNGREPSSQTGNGALAPLILPSVT